jgi:hypothetical protein
LTTTSPLSVRLHAPSKANPTAANSNECLRMSLSQEGMQAQGQGLGQQAPRVILSAAKDLLSAAEQQILRRYAPQDDRGKEEPPQEDTGEEPPRMTGEESSFVGSHACCMMRH